MRYTSGQSREFDSFITLPKRVHDPKNCSRGTNSWNSPDGDREVISESQPREPTEIKIILIGYVVLVTATRRIARGAVQSMQPITCSFKFFTQRCRTV